MKKLILTLFLLSTIQNSYSRTFDPDIIDFHTNHELETLQITDEGVFFVAKDGFILKMKDPEKAAKIRKTVKESLDRIKKMESKRNKEELIKALIIGLSIGLLSIYRYYRNSNVELL
jgi:hypothetical protein